MLYLLAKYVHIISNLAVRSLLISDLSLQSLEVRVLGEGIQKHQHQIMDELILFLFWRENKCDMIKSTKI